MVDRQRVGAHPHLALAKAHDPAREVDLEVHQVAAALQEVAAVGPGMEANDVVREQSAEDLLADPRGQHPPGVRLRPGDVNEVMQERVRARAAHEIGERVEVVVVDHHDRFAHPVELLHNGAREVFVDDVVAKLEGLDLLATDIGCVRQIPQVVLDEPQHGIREHVVETVVSLWVADHQAHLVFATARGSDRERAAALLTRYLGVVLVHRRGDPDRFAVRGEASERGHQPARSALHLAARLERDGTPVAHQHQRSPLCRLAAHASLSSLKMRR
jgi:hypothetical protein